MKRIRELRKALDSGLLSAKELLSACLYGLSGDSEFGAAVCTEDAFALAKRADELIALKSARDLTGIPVCVDAAVAGAVPATIYKKLLGYGAVIAAQIPSHISQRRNGVVAAVAQGYAAGGYTSGADLTAATEVRESALCLLKASRGVVSRYGVVPFASSFDAVAVVSHSADDIGILMDAVTDFDPRDPLMVQPNCYGYSGKIGTSLSGLTVGFSSGQRENAVVKKAFEQLSKAGASCKWIKDAVPCDCKDVYKLISAAEYSLTQAGEGSPLALAGRTILGEFPAEMEAAYARASEIYAGLSKLFSESCDVLVAIADEAVSEENFTILPVVSGHPVFIQGNLACIGKMYDEETIIAVMAALEKGE